MSTSFIKEFQCPKDGDHTHSEIQFIKHFEQLAEDKTLGKLVSTLLNGYSEVLVFGLFFDSTYDCCEECLEALHNFSKDADESMREAMKAISAVTVCNMAPHFRIIVRSRTLYKNVKNIFVKVQPPKSNLVKCEMSYSFSSWSLQCNETASICHSHSLTDFLMKEKTKIILSPINLFKTMLSPQPLESGTPLVLDNVMPSNEVEIGFTLRLISIVPPSVSVAEFDEFKKFMNSMSYKFFTEKKKELTEIHDAWKQPQNAEKTTSKDDNERLKFLEQQTNRSTSQ